MMFKRFHCNPPAITFQRFQRAMSAGRTNSRFALGFNSSLPPAFRSDTGFADGRGEIIWMAIDDKRQEHQSTAVFIPSPRGRG